MLNHHLVRRFLSRSGPAALLLVFWSVAVAASLALFTTAYDGADRRIEREVNTEADVTGFELARKGAAGSSYTAIGNVAAPGLRRYQFSDTNAYRSTADGAGPAGPLAGGPVTYRLPARSPSGNQRYPAAPAGPPSTVRRSWSTIKSMFR